MNLIQQLLDQNAAEISTQGLDQESKRDFGQFFTPLEIAIYMSSLFNQPKKKSISLLDPGAGAGNLTLAFIQHMVTLEKIPKKIHVDVYEIDSNLLPHLENTLNECQGMCMDKKIDFSFNIINQDFIFNFPNQQQYDYVILNPPYKKLDKKGEHNEKLMQLNINVPNYYAAFVALSSQLLSKNGELIAIIPRSFCNGLYFKEFRKYLYHTLTLEKIHMFEDRDGLFYDDVLQETLIIKYSNSVQKSNHKVQIITSNSKDFNSNVYEDKPLDDVVFPTDKLLTIRISSDMLNDINEKIQKLNCTLADLGINVSTGPIEDFRQRDSLLDEPTHNCFPLIYQHNIVDLNIRYPYHPASKPKPGYIIETDKNTRKLLDTGLYIIVNRVSAKEETRRIRAAIFNGADYFGEKVGFDNKLNFFHINKNGFTNKNLATGLWVFLNTNLVDCFFRTFSGSTQVNATDLRENLRYPTQEQLESIGELYNNGIYTVEQFDALVESIIFK